MADRNVTTGTIYVAAQGTGDRNVTTGAVYVAAQGTGDRNVSAVCVYVVIAPTPLTVDGGSDQHHPPTVRFIDRDFDEDLSLVGITATAKRLTWNAQGGPETADLIASGVELALWQLGSILRYGVEVVNERGEAIWWGFVHRVNFHKGGVTFGLSLDRMHNSIAVTYVTIDREAGTTAFLADADSVAEYGTKQLLISADNITTAMADQRRISELARRKLPIISTIFDAGGKGIELSVTLECRGWLETLSWPYYSRAEGLLEYLPSSETFQKIGMGFTNDQIAWESNHTLRSFTALLGNFQKDDVLYSTGSSINSGFYTVDRAAQGEPVEYVKTTISFDAATKEIRDSSNGLRGFEPREVIHILGSGVNSGFQRIESVAADGSLLVVVGTLVDEVAGASISLWTGQQILLKESVGDELPGTAITVTSFGSQIAQSLQVTSPLAWTAATAAVMARKVGSPTDNLRLAIYSDSSGSPGTLLDSATIAGTSVPAGVSWTSVDLANTQSLAVGTTYWIVVSRTGAHNSSDYYEVVVDTDLGYATYVLKMWEGTVWLSRTPDADMPFRITGSEDTGAQIESIAAESEFIVRSEVISSGTSTNQWRYGDNTALVELMELLNLGTSNDLRMLATITRERTLIVSEEPTKPDPILFYQRVDGAIVDEHGQPLIDIYPPIGQWMDFLNVIPDAVQLAETLKPGAFILERAEYDVERRTWRISVRDALDVWELGTIREG